MELNRFKLPIGEENIMINRHVPKLIIYGFIIVTFVMISYTLVTSSVFAEETNNYIIELQDNLSMKADISIGTHIVLEDVLRMEDSING